MITDTGQIHIKRYLAGNVNNIAEYIAFGLGVRDVSAEDTSLQFEVERSIISITSYDFINDRLIFKADVPSILGGKIYETALVYGPPSYNTKMITTFDSSTEIWSTDGGDPVFNSVNTRIGIDSLRISPTSSNSSTSTFSNINFDFSDNSGSDKFILAFNNGNDNVTSIKIDLKTDASNYYRFTITNPSVGYNIEEMLKSTVNVTGSPSWSNITFIEFTVTADASGAGQVDFDGFQIQEQTIVRQDQVLVSREVLETPFVKVSGMSQEIEYTLDVNIST